MATLLFTNSTALLSRIICEVTGEPVSHVAILLENGDYVVHATIPHVKKETLRDFLFPATGKRDVWAALPFEKSDEEILAWFEVRRKSSYDAGALLFAGLRLLASRVGIPVSKKNLWQTSGAFMCTELVTAVSGDEAHLLTPYQLWKQETTKNGNNKRN